jgi:hypothetical protein
MIDITNIVQLKEDFRSATRVAVTTVALRKNML